MDDDMAVTQELMIARIDDVPVFARATELRKLVRDALAAAPRTASPELLGELRLASITLCALVAEGLRARHVPDELRRYRQADDVLESLRVFAWHAFDRGLVSTPLFDELMTSSARVRHELDAQIASTRRHAHRSLEAA